MNYFFKQLQRIFGKNRGFVLPFTLLICAILLLISVSISGILTKQIYFSNLARDSQIAYYAADNALACTLAIDETYTDVEGIGIFPYSSGSPVVESTEKDAMLQVLVDIDTKRQSLDPPLYPLAQTLSEVQCAQATMLDDTANFSISPDLFSRVVGAGTEYGRTSTFLMKMKIADNEYRCAKVTIRKTQSYRQIISQGYSRCDRANTSIERAIINTSILQ